MEKTRLAILGATSHIAKGLIFNFLQKKGVTLHLYARVPRAVRGFIESLGCTKNKDIIVHDGYADFLEDSYDAIINCIGVGTAKKLSKDYSKYFTVIEEFDNLAISYLRDKNLQTLYISFSSGAVYGRRSVGPFDENTVNGIMVNHVAKEDYFAIARLYCETKHRSLGDLNIVDLRLFSYFSRFIDLTDDYFITDLLRCILEKNVLLTDDKDIVRDYLHPADLFSAVEKCLAAGKINGVFDITSVKPVSKAEILEYFSREYGLKYKTGRPTGSTTGFKDIYYSKCSMAASIGYRPSFSSMDAIKQEAKYILNRH